VLVVSVAYAVGALFAFLAFNATSIIVLFLPAGVTSSALILTRRAQWSYILAAVALTELAVDLSQGESLGVVWGFALANTVEPLVGVLLLRRLISGPLVLSRRDDLRAFLSCCVLAGPAVGGVIGAATISLGRGGSWITSVPPFWAGDALGVLTVGGAVLTAQPPHSWTRHGLLRWLAAVLGTVVLTAAAFWPSDVPLFYLPLLLLFWLAFEHGLTLTVSSGLAMTVTANLMTRLGRGPWAELPLSPQFKTATLQLFLGVAILGAWFLAVGVAERDIARTDTYVERAARRRLNALQAVTAQLATAATSPAIADIMVRDGLSLLAQHGSVAVLEPGGNEVATWMTPRPAEMVERLRHLQLDARTPVTEAIRTGSRSVSQSFSQIEADYPDLAEIYRTLEVNSGLCVPVFDDTGSVLGSLAFWFHAENAVDEDAIAFAEALATLCGQALRRARLYEQQVDAAHQLQHALLPVLREDLYGVEVAAEYRPADRANEVGGDWYDVFALPGGRIGFAVGDVVGHDLRAAAAMARLQAALRIVASSASGPADVLERLDRASAVIANSWMTTVGYGEYDPRTRLLGYACAGHPPPLLLCGETAELLWDGRSLPVGVEELPRAGATRAVAPGSTLIWYSDGLLERPDEPLREGFERLTTLAVALHRDSADSICGRLISGMLDGRPARDDIVVLRLRFTAAPRPQLATALTTGADQIPKVDEPRSATSPS
jgi:serine phosphatase RsbU (regulator of sigma subunit)/integral membrane sensor domain MASE1